MEVQSKHSLVQNLKDIVIDFGEICRFCLAETTSKITILDSVFNDDSIDLNLDTIHNFVQKLSSVKMNIMENFPSSVCENCYEVIKVCYKFSKVCQQSDSLLKDCYKKTLKEAKAKLSNTDATSKDLILENSSVKNNSANINLNAKVEESLENNKKCTILKWMPLSLNKCRNSVTIKANSIKLKYQRINYLSKRLKEAYTKLAENKIKSDDMLLKLPKSEDLVKFFETQKSPFECPECSLKFNTPEILKFHYMAIHGKNKMFKPMTRFQCNKNFSEQQELLKHGEEVHEVPEAQSQKVDLNCKVKETTLLRKRKFYCLHCVPYKIFLTQIKLLNHLKEKHKICDSGESKSLYFCSHCKNKMTFPSKLSLHSHLESVHNIKGSEITQNDFKCQINSQESEQKPFQVFLCKECSPPVSFKNLKACLQHRTEKHIKPRENKSKKELSVVENELKVVCENCVPPLEFSSTNEFVNHTCTNHNDNNTENWNIVPLSEGEVNKNLSSDQWKCSDCFLSFSQRKLFVHHMKEKHNKTSKVIQCPESNCFENFITNRQLIQHGITTHHKYFANIHSIYTKNFLESTSEDSQIKNFECDICQKKYVCKNSLKRHILKIHLGKTKTESVICSYCGKTLSSKLNLKSHIEFVHEAVFVSCPICRKNINFKTIGKHYKTHQTNFQSVDSKNKFLCNFCGKILKSKRSFQDHQNLHKNIKDHLCDICGSGFTSKKFLLLHKKTHEGLIEKKMFNCHQCDKVFSGRHTLNRHLLTHSGQKNFICEICSKCFYTLQELNRHVRYHKKDYRFDCQLCDMRFLDKSRFRHHMMKHRNVRPHKCQFCDKMFIVRGKMNMHMAAKHNVQIQIMKPVWKDPKTYVPLDDLL